MLDKLKELEQNEEFMKKLESLTDGEEIEKAYEEAGVKITYDDLEAMGFGVESEELDETELSDVAGGMVMPIHPRHTPILKILERYLRSLRNRK